MTMQEFYAYHVVTDRPMELGQHIIFDDDHHSGVYQRVMMKAGLVGQIYSQPDKYPADSLDYPTMVALRELALEQVRSEKFPHYPSRMACLYVSREVEDAHKWGEFFARIGRPTYAVVELKITGRVFTGNACNCFDGTPDKAVNLVKADHYWQNLPNEDNEYIWEMLADGDIEVVRVIEEINANLA
jgi:hypothetical protein